MATSTATSVYVRAKSILRRQLARFLSENRRVLALTGRAYFYGRAQS